MDIEPDNPVTDAAIAPPAFRRGPHWFALLATVFTWPLLFIGGLVTTYRVGMAVPDWPTTFGINMFLYDMTRASWAVFGEHTHRLYGAAVGVFTILMAGDFLLFDRRRWMKGLGVLALALVIVQGVLGGYRVRLNSTMLAAVHGVTAEAFFGLMVALCVLTGRAWVMPRRSATGSGRIGRMGAAMLGLIFLQVILGARVRHYSDSHALAAHAVVAFLTLGHAAGLVAAVWRRRGDWPELVPSARALGVTLIAQIGLGVGAWWLLRPYDGIARAVSIPQALIRTGHQANAALLLASAVVLTLRAFGQFQEKPAVDPTDWTSARELEAIA